MLPRRFALIRHVDYTGGAGTGVIAYGVAFDDGQVVLRWSSAHRATSVLDSVEDLVAAHGHGETTSIEWIDAPSGEDDAPARAGRRARRSQPTTDDQPSGNVSRTPETPPTAPAEPAHAPAAPQTPGPDGPAHTRPTAQAPKPAPAVAETGGSTAPVPTTPAAASATSAQPATDPAAQPPAPASPARPTTPAQPATPTEPATAEQPAAATRPTPDSAATPAQSAASAKPVPTQPAAPAESAMPAPAPPTHPPPEQPAADKPSWEPAQSTGDPATQPNVAASLGVSRLTPKTSTGAEPTQETPAPRPAAHASPTSNGAAHSSNASKPAEPPFDGTVPSPGDERRSRHEAIATQPMNAEFSDESEPRRPRRAGPPTHESPRSIFEEAEESPRPGLRLASSNGQVHEPDDADEPGNEPPARNESGGLFATGHQHLETVTGLLDLPAGLDKRGRGAQTEQDPLESRRNGRHRGE